MNPVAKALWFIETHFGQEITLDDVSSVSEVSRFHLSRAFGLTTGLSIMRYVRGRRFTRAARTLSQGAPDILGVAVEAGYGSHEAFTRAFRDQFGVTPETVRARGNLDEIKLTEPIKMDGIIFTQLDPPRFEDGTPLLIAGLGECDSSETSADIPAQSRRFVPHLGYIPGRIGHVTYSVICNGDNAGNIEYICGVEVSAFDRLPAEFSRVRIAPRRYAVFTHREHISTIRRTWFSIYKCLPESGNKAAEAPEFKRYTEAFNPATGMGGVEIWIPLKG